MKQSITPYTFVCRSVTLVSLSFQGIAYDWPSIVCRVRVSQSCSDRLGNRENSAVFEAMVPLRGCVELAGWLTDFEAGFLTDLRGSCSSSLT